MASGSLTLERELCLQLIDGRHRLAQVTTYSPQADLSVFSRTLVSDLHAVHQSSILSSYAEPHNCTLAEFTEFIVSAMLAAKCQMVKLRCHSLMH